MFVELVQVPLLICQLLPESSKPADPSAAVSYRILFSISLDVLLDLLFTDVQVFTRLFPLLQRVSTA